MNEINGLLDKAAQVCGAQTDSALARSLHVTRGAVYNWRHGIAAPDPVTCARIADITGDPLPRVLGLAGEVRAKSVAEKAVWRKLARMAACVLVAVLASAGAVSDAVASVKSGASGAHQNMHYAQLRAWLAALLSRPRTA